MSIPNFALEPEERPRFENPRDAVLLAIGRSALVKSGGDTEAITGWFCQISAGLADTKELASVFAHEIATAALQDVKSLIGHFVLQEAWDGAVSVHEYETERQARLVCDGLRDVYEHYGIDQVGL